MNNTDLINKMAGVTRTDHKFIQTDIGEWFDEYTCACCNEVRYYPAEDLMSSAKANVIGTPCNPTKGNENACISKTPQA